MSQENPLLGTWSLVSASAIYADGSVTPEVYGANPKGYITYTAAGRMMVMFARGDRPALSKPVGSPLSSEMDAIPTEELARAFTSFSAYAGTYSIEGNTVTHRLEVASIPNRVGTDLVRTFTISGNRVTLRTAPTDQNGGLQVFDLVWERV
ncbi:lipocalin-like domain-containing protein [Nodosilinea nodulosa]|uniref:lipocalin-like domain-containing protein n=1 Tax=Nodosilinea nodulosa TaxID=416001 RepID=UPI0002F58A27|nr:lipocalin-like domain-containing protein [Nodosilinea nodulosa]